MHWHYIWYVVLDFGRFPGVLIWYAVWCGVFYLLWRVGMWRDMRRMGEEERIKVQDRDSRNFDLNFQRMSEFVRSNDLDKP